ncbi:hypothetical protein [Rossellomorea marisflavi]|uniref:hypothetical protein n=1 Tax=Rossellomorea marisflavi TaxID=189381 RepID=UPI003F9FD977
MKKALKKIQNSKGFVSLEVIIIAGALIILGAFILSYFNGKAETITKSAGDQLTIANDKMNADDE